MNEKSRVAIVTGASRGIGSVTAAALAAKGFRVANLSRKGIGPEDRVRGTEEARVSVDFACDITDDQAIQRDVRTEGANIVSSAHFSQVLYS